MTAKPITLGHNIFLQKDAQVLDESFSVKHFISRGNWQFMFLYRSTLLVKLVSVICIDCIFNITQV